MKPSIVRRTTFRLAAVLGCASTLMFLSGPVAAQSKAPIKIGVPTALSGPYAQIGGEVKRSVDFAAKEVNAKGGILGRMVQVEFADTEANPDVARRTAERLVQNGYKLLIGTIASSEALAIGAQVEKWDAIYMSTINKTDRLTGDACNSRVFRANHSDAQDMMVIGPWLKTRAEKEWVIMAADYAWGRDSASAFTKAAQAQGRVVKAAYFAPLGSKDYASYIQQLKAQNAQAMWVAVGGRDAINFGIQADQFGLLKSVFPVGQAFAVPATIKGMGAVSEGIWGVHNYAVSLDTPQNKAFVTTWKKEFNGADPSNYEAETYVGMQVLFAGIAKAGSDEPGKVAKAMEDLSIDNTIYGKVTMRAKDHQLVMPNYMGKVAKVGGELKPVIELVVDAAQATPPPAPECKMN